MIPESKFIEYRTPCCDVLWLYDRGTDRFCCSKCGAPMHGSIKIRHCYGGRELNEVKGGPTTSCCDAYFAISFDLPFGDGYAHCADCEKVWCLPGGVVNLSVVHKKGDNPGATIQIPGLGIVPCICSHKFKELCKRMITAERESISSGQDSRK